ncbi:MSHA biogenesis protein MshQ [Gammaproteobacteria bacterium]
MNFNFYRITSYFQLFGMVLLTWFILNSAHAVTDSFSSPGNFSWTAPAGVTSATVEAWGGGGAGGGATGNPAKGGGGAGGQYASKVVTVIPGTAYSVVVGVGGTGSTGNGTAGGDSGFAGSVVVAKGGAGGGGAASNNSGGAGGTGSTLNGVGDTVYAGGNGSNGVSTGTGGAGGGGAGSTNAGGNASGNTAGTGTANGGGNGGAGLTSSGTGNTGITAGGGGGGGYATSSTNRNGGSGGSGQVKITYIGAPTITTNAVSNVTSTSATLNGTVSSNGAITTVTFDYGLTTSYGNTVTAIQSPLATNASGSAISAIVTGLTCNTTYHFRAKGVNSVGITNGSDITFITSACPSVVSINRTSTDPTTANAAVSWVVIFSVSVSGVDATDFSLVPTGGVTGTTISSVSGSGTTWTVTANTGTGTNGTLGLNLVDNDSIVDSAGSSLGGTGTGNSNFTGQVYTVSPPVPTLSKIASTSAATINDVITFTLSATNNNGVALANVALTDVLPSGMNYVNHVTTLGSVVVTAQTITWTIPALPANGGNAQLLLAVALTQQGSLTNTVTSPGASSQSATVLVLANAITHFKLDETVGSWTGASSEVIDSGGTALHGHLTTTPTCTTPVSPNPTIASQYSSVIGGFCNAGQFDGKAIVAVADSPLFDYTTQLSASAWIYPTAYPSSDLYSILSNDTNYEFHLNPSGKLFWWWNVATLTSSAIIPLNKWTHIAITFNSAVSPGRQRIYINGVADSSTNNWYGTLQANTCPFYIGGDISTGSGCSLMPGRNFHGMIDEVKLYNYELSAAEVNADMILGRSCSGTFDHVQIEHDGIGSICNNETVTIKTCLDSSCSMLYTGNVTIRLSPTGWVGGDTFTMTGGMTTRQLSYVTASSITLGTVNVSPPSANATRCFIGSNQNCTMTFAAASCSFDAIETGAAPKTHIYTKLANTAFALDVVALSSGSTINTTYTGTVAVDLVDASSSACPTGSGLNTAQSISFVTGNLGRKNMSFNYANAAKNVRVRMQVGSGTPACSTNNFAIRPQSFTISSSNANADSTGTSPSATPKIKTGSTFNLSATAVTGYDGTPLLQSNSSRNGTWLEAHSGANRHGIASGTFNGANSATGIASGSVFVYDEVGYFRLKTNAVYDDTFTAIDNAAGDCTNDFSNSLVSGKYGCKFGNNTDTVYFGRFYPDHFNITPETSGDSLIDRIDVNTGTSETFASTFTYLGEEFKTRFILTARNASDVITQNYTGSFAKFDPTAWSNFVFAANNLPTGSTLGTGATPPSGTWSNGTANITAFHKVSRAASPVAPSTNVTITAKPVDSDGVTTTSSMVTHNGSTDLRFGRLRLSNAFGSEKANLSIPVQTQYWSGNSWIINNDDSCTSLPSNTFVLSETPGTSGTINTTASAINVSGGNGTLSLTAPNPTATGSVDITANLANLSWLRAPNGSCSTYSCDPSARATFGIYSPETRKTIHIRELY